MEQLSTGKRINSAADDAAGMAIVSKMTSQIRGLDQAWRNVNDAISMIQTAEGATVEIANMLQRMRELAVQASSGTYTTEDKANIELEFQALLVGIDNIADTTQWNGMNILDGAGAATVFQIGVNDGQTLTVDLGNMRTDAYRGVVDAVDAIDAADGRAGVAFVTTSLEDIENMTELTVGGGGRYLTVEYLSFGVGATAHDLVAALMDINDNIFNTYWTAEAVDSNGDSSNTSLKITENVGFFTSDGPIVSSYRNPNLLVSLTIGEAAIDAADAIDAVPAVLELGADISALISTREDVLELLDVKLSAISTQLATYGAAINQLEYTADNLTNLSQNTQASRSSIEDADYAKATTELARTQIIQQAGTAMLAQANQQPQGVLTLLN
tara:strand:- start:1037 stop:2191 length:1155 start_codon:yes stop_codon:yes gene_type:complete